MDDLTNNKEYECSHCDGTGITYIYSKDGVINMPCPECTDEMSHIRNWEGQMFDG